MEVPGGTGRLEHIQSLTPDVGSKLEAMPVRNPGEVVDELRDRGRENSVAVRWRSEELVPDDVIRRQRVREG